MIISGRLRTLVVGAKDAIAGEVKRTASGWNSAYTTTVGNLVTGVRTHTGRDAATATPIITAGSKGRLATAVFSAEARSRGISTESEAAQPISRMPVTVRDRAADPAAAERSANAKVTRGDPVDVATGEVILTEVDLDLPGVLPLRLSRTYLSGFDAGHRFGRRWASTLDQRIEAGLGHLALLDADGSIRSFPYPDGSPVTASGIDDSPQLLCHDPAGGFRREDPASGLVWLYQRTDSVPWPEGVYPLTLITDRHSNWIRFEHNESGAVSALAHSGGYRVLVSTDARGRVTGLDVRDPLAGTDTRARAFDYDAQSRLARVHDACGNVLSFDYDANDRLTAWIDAVGYRFSYSYDERGRCITQRGDDGALAARFDYREDSAGSTTVHTDSLGATTKYRIDNDRRVVSITDAYGAVSTAHYDRVQRTRTVTDPAGRTTRWVHDEHGMIVRVVRADGKTATAAYHAPGKPRRITQFDGAVWTYTYDARGNPIAVTDPCGATVHYGWHPDGSVATITDSTGATTRIDSNAAGLPLTVTSSGGGVTRFHYDAHGRCLQPDVDVDRDDCGYPVRRTRAGGAVERWCYDAHHNVVEYADAMGATTHYEYGPFGQLVRLTAPDGATTSFAYDTELRLVAVTNPRGEVWRYGRDQGGRLVSECDYQGHSVNYHYDAAGRVTAKVNDSGEAITYEYDQIGNLVGHISATDTVTFGYDQMGRISSGRNQHSTVVFHRDRCGRVTAETVNGRTVTSGYDRVGRRTSGTTPAGISVAWRYDNAGRVAETSIADQTFRSAHDAAGREVRRDLSSDLVLRYRYARPGRAIESTLLTHRSGSGGHEQILLRRDYVRRLDGAIERRHDDHGTHRYRFDPCGRITEVAAPHHKTSYTYDLLGNITAAVVRGPVAAGGRASIDDGVRETSFEYRGSLLTRAGLTTFAYDTENRPVRRTPRRPSNAVESCHYRWNSYDQLVAVELSDGSEWRYHYDAFGRRISKTHYDSRRNAVTSHTTFTWDRDRLIEESSDSGKTTTWAYPPDGLSPIAEYRYGTTEKSSGAAIFAIVADLVGTPTHLIDIGARRVAGTAMTDLWGAGEWSGDTTPIRFPGQYYDQESGLHYNRHRYYDPATARYLTADPLGLAPAPNPWAYVADPTRYADPLGLDPKHVDLYHGTNSLSAWHIREFGIRTMITPGDFGRGFYLTRHIDEAGFWATRPRGHDAILHFRFAQSDLDALNSKLFTATSPELPQFVSDFRMGRRRDTPYSMVEGPVLVGPSDFLERNLAPKWWGNQVSFAEDTYPLANDALQPETLFAPFDFPIAESPFE